MRLTSALALLALSCGGETSTYQEALSCAWPEQQLIGECVRFTAKHAGFSLEGQQCEPVACLVVPFGGNDGTLQQVQVREPGPDYTEADGPPDAYQVDLGPCLELQCVP